MKLQLTPRTDAPFLVAVQHWAAGAQACLSIGRHLFGKDSTNVHEVPGAGFIVEVEIQPRAQVVDDDPIGVTRELLRLAVHALRVAKSEGCRRCPQVNVKWFSIEADNANVVAILDGNVLHVHTSISVPGFMQWLRSDLGQLLLVDCVPSLLPELEPGETWNDILEPTLSVGSETKFRTCVVMAHDALAGFVTVSEVGNKAVVFRVRGRPDQIQQLMAGYSPGRALEVDYTENGELLLRREKYRLVGWEWLGEQQELFAGPATAAAPGFESAPVG